MLFRFTRIIYTVYVCCKYVMLSCVVTTADRPMLAISLWMSHYLNSHISIFHWQFAANFGAWPPNLRNSVLAYCSKCLIECSVLPNWQPPTQWQRASWFPPDAVHTHVYTVSNAVTGIYHEYDLMWSCTLRYCMRSIFLSCSVFDMCLWTNSGNKYTLVGRTGCTPLWWWHILFTYCWLAGMIVHIYRVRASIVALPRWITGK